MRSGWKFHVRHIRGSASSFIHRSFSSTCRVERDRKSRTGCRKQRVTSSGNASVGEPVRDRNQPSPKTRVNIVSTCFR